MIDYPSTVMDHPVIKRIRSDRTYSAVEKLMLITSNSIKIDPVWAVGAYFGMTQVWDDGPGTPCQGEMLRAVLTDFGTEIEGVEYKWKVITVPAGNSLGKTHGITHGLIPGWMFSRIGGKVMYSASGEKFIKTQVWPDLFRCLSESPLDWIRNTASQKCLAINSYKWRPSPDRFPEWIAFGISPNKIDAFHGYHPPVPLLVILDEAQSEQFTPSACGAVYSILIGNPQHKALFTGNPVRTSGEFAETIRYPEAKRAYKIQLSAYNNPNFKERKIVIPGLPTPSDIDDMKDRYRGEDDPEFRARVLGEIARIDEMSLVGVEDIMEIGVDDELVPDWKELGSLRLVIDFAEKIDRSVFSVMTQSKKPMWIIKTVVKRGLKGNIPHKEIIDSLIAEFSVDDVTRITRIRIDAIGKGSPLAFDLEAEGYPIERFEGSQNAFDSKQYRNSRTESAFQLKYLILSKMMAIPNSQIALYYEIANLKYKMADDRYALLSKDQYIHDFGLTAENSPDVADVACMGAWDETRVQAFKVAKPLVIAMLREPSIEKNESEAGKFNIFFKGMEFAGKRSGLLYRASMISRRGKSTVIWAHRDAEGDWTIYRGFSMRDVPVSAFWSESEGAEDKFEVFAKNIVISPENPASAGGGQHVTALIHECQKKRSQLTFLPLEALSDARAIDRLDRAFLGVLADVDPKNEFWEQSHLNPKDFVTGEKIFIWPQEVVQEIVEARIIERSWKDSRHADEPTAIVAGPFVQCLRALMLAVK